MEKTTLFKERFLKLISIANRFVPLKPSLPVLANVYLKTNNGKIDVSATNLEMSVTVTTPAKSNQKWEITTPAKILNEFLATAAGTEVRLEVDKDSLNIEVGTTTATIAGIAASEFPKLAEVSGKDFIETGQKELQEAVNSVAFAASADEGKPVLTGILLKTEEDKTLVVATDGYRLAKKTLKNKTEINETLISAKTLVEVLKVAGEMEEEALKLSISPEDNQIIFTGDNFVVAARLLAGTYPDFKQIIPTKFSTAVEMNRQELTAAIKTTAVFARDLGNVVKLKITTKGQISITANTAQVGDSESVLTGNSTGEELEIAFNSKYVLDGLNSLKSEVVKLNFSGVLSPALFEDPDDKSFIYIVMPVKAQN